MDVFLVVSLDTIVCTSNMYNLALIISLTESLVLYLLETKELKCAVVGKIKPLI